MAACGTTLVKDGEAERLRLRGALGRFATGVTIVTTQTEDGKKEGVTVNSFSALSLDPPLVVWSLRRAAASFDNFMRTEHFAVNVLGAAQASLSNHFATPVPDKFVDVSHRAGYGGCPVIDGTIASFECQTDRRIEAGDHVLIIGKVTRYECREGDPLIFSTGRYCQPAAIVGLG